MTGGVTSVSVPERGFVALIHAIACRSVATCATGLTGFSPRAGIRGFDTACAASVRCTIARHDEFQSPSGDSWL